MENLKIEVIKTGEDFKRLVKPEDALEVINSLVEEKAYVLADQPYTLEQEKEWVESKAKSIDKGEEIVVALFDGDKYVGSAEARRGKQRERYNVSFGLGIKKEYRGKGFGKKLLKTAIEEAKRTLKPHKMWIEVYEDNSIAHSLYKKLGFVDVAKLGEYIYYGGQWKNKIIMELRE